MKNYVITILSNEKSVKVAERCIESGNKFDIDIKKFKAITPKDNPHAMMMQESINPYDFNNDKYSRIENMQSCFLSHYFLWKRSVELNEEITIFEHDVVIVDNIPNIEFKGCVNFGRPSYGKFVTPKNGIQKLVSKQYFPGAHAYRVNPEGAKKLIERSKIKSGPADVFLHNMNFNFLEEYYPWPVIADDSFTTIQKETGCLAKHNYQKDKNSFQIL
jgi:GR25 family glycosyltransferase involved in LPS biosynthesis